MPATTDPKPTIADMARDVQLARALTACPSDERARACRERLGGYIAVLAGFAEVRVREMQADRARDVAEHLIRHARHLMADPHEGDPVAGLRLRAGAVDQLMRYATRTPKDQANHEGKETPWDVPTAVREATRARTVTSPTPDRATRATARAAAPTTTRWAAEPPASNRP
ncbi:hypothetical protein [Streptomyces violascens]|uniref:hypothetical protein n=1 Tax=Streptomyces violascens TaxID=67381 RepID=UPI0036D0DCE4